MPTPSDLLPVRRKAPTGPAAHLTALPQLPDEVAATPEQVDAYLADMESARRAQLDALPPDPGTPVAEAHRRTVVLLLDQLHAARARLRAGTYGACSRCSATIPARAIEAEPWRTSCPPCAGRPADR